MRYPDPTPEQTAILDAFGAGDTVTIVAAAGSGKTTSLRMIAEAAGLRKGLYVAYNKAIASDADASFPSGTLCKTAHALAYRAIGCQYRDRLNGPRVPAMEAARILKINEALKVSDHSIQPKHAARLAQETVQRFCHSSEDEVQPWHVPAVPGLEGIPERSAVRGFILPFARRAWEDLRQTAGQLRFTHDVYLKIWGLSRPQLPYDFILFDEAQDANPVVLAVVRDQGHAQLIAVGDPNQAIYCQPVGTLVEIPVAPDEVVPAERQCGFGPCPRQRDHITSGLCDQHEQQARTGKPLTPIRRQMQQAQTRKVPIESLTTGDLVVTYDNSHLFRRGRPVTSVTRFPYSGPLVSVTTSSGLASSYTPQHHCIVRIGHELDGKHLVYLMRRGDRFRIGRVPVFYQSQGGVFGLGLRASCEGADAAWILSVHDSVKEAALAEALAQHQFNIPGVRFEPSAGDVLEVRTFWEKHGPNGVRAEECLNHHGRLIDFPLWVSGSSNLVGVRRPFVTAAANLVDGFKVLPVANAFAYRGKRELSAPASTWETVRAERTWYEGEIVSLEVADHHNYFADGILTHNSWRGAVDAMDQFKGGARLYLSKSFRFGPEIAHEANKWLEVLDAELRVTGFERVNSVVGSLPNPEAVLCRTNAEAISQVMSAVGAGRRAALVGGGDEMLRLAQAAVGLKAGIGTDHPELFAFRTWAEVQDYAENDAAGGDLKVFVNLVDKHGPDAIIDTLQRLTRDEARADVVISTAHKAKGREWDGVKVAGDFREPKKDEDGEQGQIQREDAMLAYVTVTRAKLALDRSGLAWVDHYLPGAKG